MFVLSQGSSSVQLAHHRSPYLRIMLLALLAHLMLFVFAPPFTFTPYQAKEEIIVCVFPPPPIDEILPPPPEENRIPVNTIAAMDDDADDGAVIPRTMYDDPGVMPTGARCMDKRPPDIFYAFDEPPVLIHFERPVYPEFSREAGIEGAVAVKVVVDRNGKVIDAVVLASEVTVEMEQAALMAARGCLFKPGKQRGAPVPVAVMVPFEFRLSDCR